MAKAPAKRLQHFNATNRNNVAIAWPQVGQSLQILMLDTQRFDHLAGV